MDLDVRSFFQNVETPWFLHSVKKDLDGQRDRRSANEVILSGFRFFHLRYGTLRVLDVRPAYALADIVQGIENKF